MPPAGLQVLVGGVGELFQSDRDLGRLVVETLAASELPPGVLVEDLSYGAIAVSHRLRELAPATLILVGTTERGRPPGTIHRRRVVTVERSADELQGAVLDAGTGYVDLDLTLDVAWAFEVLPDRAIVFEIEPAATGPGEEPSVIGRATIAPVCAAIRRECRLLVDGVRASEASVTDEPV